MAEGDQFAYLRDEQQADIARIQNQLDTLRTWGIEAANTTATSGNNVAVTNAILDRLEAFFPALANYIEAELKKQYRHIPR